MIKTWKPTTAGILSIISGAIGIIFGLLAFVRDHHIDRVIRHVGLDSIGFMLVVLGILAITGGIYALLRKVWGLALAGAICAILSPGWVMGILATIFVSISKDEFEKTHIEISVIGPLKKINNISEIVLGKHGIYIKKDAHSGTMLPQVATENHWSVEEFLGYTSRDKAGLGWSGWKDADIFIYEAAVLEENKK
jgi:vacuolar-type H+-ATPase subunit I/STV1